MKLNTQPMKLVWQCQTCLITESVSVPSLTGYEKEHLGCRVDSTFINSRQMKVNATISYLKNLIANKTEITIDNVYDVERLLFKEALV